MVNTLIESDLDVNKWMSNLPSVSSVRPPKCLGCSRGRARDGLLGMYGHGVRVRDLVVGEKSEAVEISLRRYRCRDCQRVVTVGPRCVVARRVYDRTRIAVVLVLWAMGGEPLRSLRATYSWQNQCGMSDEHEWPMVRRWAREGQRIFGERCPAGEGSVRSIARRIAQWILSHAPPELKGSGLSERVASAMRSGAF